MTDLPELKLDVEFAPFTELQKLLGFVPYLFRIQRLLPRMVEAEIQFLCALLAHQQVLSKIQKVLILLVVATACQNTYCVTAWREVLRSYEVSEAQIEDVVENHRAAWSTTETALINFAFKLTANSSQVSTADILTMQECGFQRETVLEVILIVAMSRFFCKLAIGLQPPLDIELSNLPMQGNSTLGELSHPCGFSEPSVRQEDLSTVGFSSFAFLTEWFESILDVFRNQRIQPKIIEAEASFVQEILFKKNFLPATQKVCLLLVSSAKAFNSRWVAVCLKTLGALGLSRKESEQIAIDHRRAALSQANKALLDFAASFVAEPSGDRHEDLNNLRWNNFTEEQIVESVLVIALSDFLQALQKTLGEDLTDAVFGRTPKPILTSIDSSADPKFADLDSALVERMQSGSVGAFEELIARYSYRIYRTLLNITENVEEAQDALQETFLKVLLHVHNFQGRSKFSTWLMSIATNAALQRLRDRKRFEPLTDDGEEIKHPHVGKQAWNADPEQLYFQAQRRRLLESGLMKIPFKYRAVVVLRDIEQLTTEEAAIVLGLSTSALKARLLRGRRMLRAALFPHFDGLLSASKKEASRGEPKRRNAVRAKQEKAK